MSQQELQQAAFELSYYRRQAEDLNRQMQFVKGTLEETLAGVKALESLKESKSESLYPLGGGSFVRAKLADNKVLVDVGARVIAERSFDDALAVVRGRADALDATMQELKQQFDVVSSRVQELSEYLQQAQQQSQQAR